MASYWHLDYDRVICAAMKKQNPCDVSAWTRELNATLSLRTLQPAMNTRVLDFMDWLSLQVHRNTKPQEVNQHEPATHLATRRASPFKTRAEALDPPVRAFRSLRS